MVNTALPVAGSIVAWLPLIATPLSRNCTVPVGIAPAPERETVTVNVTELPNVVVLGTPTTTGTLVPLLTVWATAVLLLAA